ncbi:hypothetical protein ACFQU2_05845 [Siccirubricoccus deserti]|uniref:Uncharacterized protein n=1 Tax=Siccirubricoccus deserti TaxID=2013562 RepID=A0A9X0UK92_9PROT|nr:hypothetical protein [Siccirubricoccus deserti]MBC4018925.1 hypothetical protein [Siccirubricoccus deserti]
MGDRRIEVCSAPAHAIHRIEGSSRTAIARRGPQLLRWVEADLYRQVKPRMDSGIGIDPVRSSPARADFTVQLQPG